MNKKLVGSIILSAALGATSISLLEYTGPKTIGIQKNIGPNVLDASHNTCLNDIVNSILLGAKEIGCEFREVTYNQTTEEHWICSSNGTFGSLTSENETCLQTIADSIQQNTQFIQCEFKTIEIDKVSEDRWVCSSRGYEEKSIDDLDLGETVTVIKKE